MYLCCSDREILGATMFESLQAKWAEKEEEEAEEGPKTEMGGLSVLPDLQAPILAAAASRSSAP